ncbi:MAG: hypothetical protein A2284_15920 [Deltaproteobacteria bacterium RIFOXYA12_FULL_61_11]|nr:MAG: hypothetical protein A2284_15920 [Deltaproteobacteria bacterium RIFOXYA12_FULL_61_11]
MFLSEQGGTIRSLDLLLLPSRSGSENELLEIAGVMLDDAWSSGYREDVLIEGQACGAEVHGHP